MAAKKKRGVKPGTKRSPYRKAKPRNKIIKGLQQAVEFTKLSNEQWKALNAQALADFKANSMGNLPSLISDLTSTIDTLEAQLTAQIDRIKSILV